MGKIYVCDYCKKHVAELIYTDSSGQVLDDGDAILHNHTRHQVSAGPRHLRPRLLLDRSSWNTQNYIVLEFCDERCLANWVKEQLGAILQPDYVPEK